MSKACCNNGLGEFKDFSVSDRDIKGYNGEILVKNKLEKLNVSFISNPLDSIQHWKQFQKCGSDFKIASYNIELEVKNIDGNVFRSWIIRDWIPRFSFKGEKRITAIPESTKLPITSLETLFVYDIYIVDYDSLKYIIPRANKLVRSSKRKSGVWRIKNCSFASVSEFKVKPIDSTSRFNRVVSIGKGKHETVQNDSKSSGEYRDSTDDAKPECIQINLDEYLDLKQKPTQNCSPKECTSEDFKLDCRSCTRNWNCDLFLEYLRFKEKHKNLIKMVNEGNHQLSLFDQASKKNRELEMKIKEMRAEFLELYNKIWRCINRRRYCHINLGYVCFRKRMR